MLDMKNSEIIWIGQIPSHWMTGKIKHIKDKKNPYPIGDGDHGSIKPEHYQDTGIPYIRVQNLSWDGKLLMDDIVYISEEVNNLNKKSILHPGDIVVAKTGGTIGKTAIIPASILSANTTSSVGKITVDESHSNKFFFYQLSSDVCFQQMWEKARMKSAQPGFNIDDLVDFQIVIPPLKEQLGIASFLDKQCGIVDNLTNNLYYQIEKLKQYKQSLISEVVTKGLDPNVEMKDSGVDWIGQTPDRWGLTRIKWLLNERGERSKEGSEEPLSMSQRKGLIPTKEMEVVPNMASSFVGAKLCHKGDLVFNKLKAHLGVFAVSEYDGLVSPDYAVYYPTALTSAKYLEFLFKTPIYISQFRKRSTGIAAGLTRLYTDGLFSIECSLPPIEEQQSIVQYLTEKSSVIDRVIDVKQHKIEKLNEYKKSLIYEYVTGKREVV